MEIAHGVDLQQDILDQMEFKPVIPEYVRYMDPRLFREGPMGLTPEQMEMLDPEYNSGGTSGPVERAERAADEKESLCCRKLHPNNIMWSLRSVPQSESGRCVVFSWNGDFGAAAGWPVVSAYLRGTSGSGGRVLLSLPH